MSLISGSRILITGGTGSWQSFQCQSPSAFLQGLLLMKPSDLCSYYAPYLPFISHWHDTCNKFGFSPIEPCLHFVLAHSFIDKAIIGISRLVS